MKPYFKYWTKITKEKNYDNSYLRYLNLKVEPKSIALAFEGTFVQPFYAQGLEIKKIKSYPPGKIQSKKDKLIFKESPKPLTDVLAVVFLLFFAVSFLLNFKKYENKSFIILSLSLVGLNFFYSIFYCSHECFLFSQNFFAYLIATLGMIASKIKEKLFLFVCGIFLIYQIIVNFLALNKIEKFVQNPVDSHHSFSTWALYSLITTLIFAIVYVIIKKLIKKEIFEMAEEKKYHLFIFLYLFIMVSTSVLSILFKGKI